MPVDRMLSRNVDLAAGHLPAPRAMRATSIALSGSTFPLSSGSGRTRLAR